jgi:hypothetical protein
VVAAVERDLYQSFPYQRQYRFHTLQVKRGFREDGLAGEERRGDLRRHFHSPCVMAIVAIGESHQKAGVGNPVHERENPFRDDKSRAPCTEPASFMKPPEGPPFFARSSCSRMIRPCDMPVLAAVLSSHSASSLVRRIVIV